MPIARTPPGAAAAAASGAVGGSSPGSWDRSPQGRREDHYTMHVCVPEANTWIKVDVPKGGGETGAGFTGTAASALAVKRRAERRVEVLAVKEELMDRLSIFAGGQDVYIWKCSAGEARGPMLCYSDDVYYLTWLIAYSEGAENLPGDRGDADAWRLWDERVKWTYEAPQRVDENVLCVLVFIEPTNDWQDVYVADMGCLTKGRVNSTILNLKQIVASGFDEIIVHEGARLKLKIAPEMLDVKLCDSSYPVGDPLADEKVIYNGKWYYITCKAAFAELDAMDEIAATVQGASDDCQ